MVENTIRNTIKQNMLIGRKQHIVLGLSGGPDSMCLFNFLAKYMEEVDGRLYAVHLNHCIRGRAADSDEAFVLRECEKRGIKCFTERYDCKAEAKKLRASEEEVGRNARYDLFARVAEGISKTGVDSKDIKIAVAHNADDQVETVLMRIIRGTGTKGLSGMDYERTDSRGFSIIRPLLDVGRRDIELYCENLGLEPRIDKTNLESVYGRNRVRLELIPYLEGFNPDIKGAILRLSAIASDDEAYFDEVSDRALKKVVCKDKDILDFHSYSTENGRTIEMDAKSLWELPLAISVRVIKKACSLIGLDSNISRYHLIKIVEITGSDNPSAEINLPGGRAVRRYEKLVIIRGNIDQSISEALEDTEKMQECLLVKKVSIEEYNAKKRTIEDQYPRGSYAFFDCDDMVQAGIPIDGVQWRTRQPGDYLVISGGKRKKIKNLFIDEKVPRDFRDHIMMAVSGNQVLFIPHQEGFPSASRYTAEFFVKSHTKNVLVIARFRVI